MLHKETVHQVPNHRHGIRDHPGGCDAVTAELGEVEVESRQQRGHPRAVRAAPSSGYTTCRTGCPEKGGVHHGLDVVLLDDPQQHKRQACNAVGPLVGLRRQPVEDPHRVVANIQARPWTVAVLGVPLTAVAVV